MAVSARTKAAAALALLVVVILVATRPRAPAAPQFAYSAHGFRVNGGPSRPLLEPNEAEYQMSEGGQDRVLWEELFRNDSQADSGFFVEFGARGGVYDSNTYFFEKKLGWRGLLLEASPTEQKTIGADRPLSAAIDGGVCESDQKLEFAAAEKGWGGRLDSYDKSRAKTAAFQTLIVPCFTLRTLFDLFRVRHVSYMSVDTEGSELLALKGFPWGEVSVDVVGVEVVTGSPDRLAKEAELLDYLRSKGMVVFIEYQFAKDTKDVFFRPAAPSRRAANDYAHFEKMRALCVRMQRCLGPAR